MYEFLCGFTRLVGTRLLICWPRRFVHGELADKRAQPRDLHLLSEDKAVDPSSLKAQREVDHTLCLCLDRAE